METITFTTFVLPSFNPRLLMYVDRSNHTKKKKEQNLSIVDIGKVLRIAKAAMTQQKIMALMKTYLHMIPNIFMTYVFKTF